MNSDIKTKVLNLLMQIPKGKVTTYNSIALKIGTHPRAIGSILRSNTDYKYPCYKVVKSDLSIGWYNKGYDEKLELFKNDGIKIVDGKVSKDCAFYF